MSSLFSLTPSIFSLAVLQMVLTESGPDDVQKGKERDRLSLSLSVLSPDGRTDRLMEERIEGNERGREGGREQKE